MPNLYGVIAEHDAMTCPSGNKSAREASKVFAESMQSLTQKHGIKLLSGEHFDPSHLTVVRLEANNVEAVRDFVYEAGLTQWNECRIYPLTPMDKLIHDVDKIFPKTLY